MKLEQLLENNHTDSYNILSVHRSDDWGTGTSRRGTLRNTPYQQLVGLFGKPEIHTHDNRDINAEWVLEIVYQHKGESDPENTEHVIVTIYDRNFGEEFSDPSKVTEWNCGALTNEAFWVLEEVIAKGIKVSA